MVRSCEVLPMGGRCCRFDRLGAMVGVVLTVGVQEPMVGGAEDLTHLARLAAHVCP